MNPNTPASFDPHAAREQLRAFGQHYGYDVSAAEMLLDYAPHVFAVFYPAATSMTGFATQGPKEALAVAKIAATRAEDCGPCLELTLKMQREAGVPEALIQAALRGEGLSDELAEVHEYARRVAAHEVVDDELLARLEARWGRATLGEMALAAVAGTIFPTMKRALGHAKSCALWSNLVA